MNTMKKLTATLLLASTLAAPLLAADADQKPDAKTDAKLKPYPLKTCVVSGEKLGEMGEPFIYKYKDREIKFCCSGCVKDFNKEPAKYIKKLEDAEKAQQSAKAGGAAPAAPAAPGDHQH